MAQRDFPTPWQSRNRSLAGPPHESQAQREGIKICKAKTRGVKLKIQSKGKYAKALGSGTGEIVAISGLRLCSILLTLSKAAAQIKKIKNKNMPGKYIQYIYNTNKKEGKKTKRKKRIQVICQGQCGHSGS